MLRPRKITFYKMMLAGHLSVRAYRDLKPKKQINELSFSDCFEFEPEICNELKRIFEDDGLKCNLFYLENIDDTINLEWDNIHNLLLTTIKNLSEEFISVIETIGERTFCRDYIFCSDDCFKKLDYVTDHNFEALNLVRNQFAGLYKAYLETCTLPEPVAKQHEQARTYTDIISDDTLRVSESLEEYSTASDRGYGYTNNFVIDDDALGITNSDCKKYVLFLYSLDYEQFEKFQNYLSAITSSDNCSVRLCGAIKSIGYKNFYVNYLFADDSKFLQLRNFGKRTLIELNIIKPQIISFVTEEYHRLNTDTIDNEIPKEKKIVNYESLTLREKVGEKQYALLKNLLKSLMSEVSVRTRNDINNYKGDFIEDYVHKSNIKKIRNIEIRFIISKLRKAIQLDNNIGNHETFTLTGKISESQYSLLKNLLKTLVTEAGVRARNGINNYNGDFIKDFVLKSNDVRKIRNIGRKSEIELRSIISKLRKAIDNLEQREFTEEEVFWIEKSSVYGGLIDDYCHNYYNDNGHLPMFHILANRISSLLKVKSIKVLDEVVSLFSDKKGDGLEAVAKRRNISRERIRQICADAINCLSEMYNPENSNIHIYHDLLRQDEDWAYVSQLLAEKTLWDISELEGILHHEECSMNKELALVVLSRIFSEQYSIVGRTPLSISSRSNGWRNTYFICKRLTDSFDFDAMIDIVKDYENSNTKSITLTIQELLMDTFYRAWKQYDPCIEEELEQVVGQILVGELCIIPDLDFNYTIKGKKKENTADIIYNLLKESGNPLTMDVLFNQINARLSKRYRSTGSIRLIVDKDPRLCFVGFNREVSLSEWNHVQTGSIRELIVAYLDGYETPRHINDIVEHIQKYRNTSKHSINSTMSSGNQFVKYDGGYYGLSERTYPKEYRLADSKRNAFERVSDFKLFVKNNNRFPFYPSEDKFEESLYLWWMRTKKNKEPGDPIRLMIIEIESKHSDLPMKRTDYDWLFDCQKYKDFVQSNGRRPSGKNIAEAKLANWFSVALNDVSEGKLSGFKEKEFIKLCKSL